MNEKPIRIFIAEDHKFTLEGMVNKLQKEKDFEVVATDDKGYETLNLCMKHFPDIAILDISMEESGLLLTPQIMKSCPETKIVFNSMHVDGPLLKRAFSYNIHGYIHKADPTHETPSILRDIHKGGFYFSPSISNFLAKLIFGKRETLPHEKLSKIETQTFWLILENKNAQDIADKVGKSKRTIEGQRSTIYEKLGCQNKEGLFEYAQKNHLLTP